MQRSDHYQYAQQNLELLEMEIALVRKSAQTAIGKHAWQEEKQMEPSQLEASGREVLAATRLYTFLICSWLEARLTKILYENSSCAFTDHEIKQITGQRTMQKKWELCFTMAVQKSYGFPVHPGFYDYSAQFPAGSLGLLNYQRVRNMFGEIVDAINVRNRLAHGQWEVQFNSANTRVEQYAFLTQYDNIQKLSHLKDAFSLIGEMISMYVTYKDKQNPNFDHLMDKKILLVMDKKSKAEHMDYAKYAAQLRKTYDRNRDRAASR